MITDLETCKQEFRVVSRSGGLKAEQYLESTVKDYVKQIENLFPAWKDQQAHVNVKKIQDLEQEKSFTDQRRQLAKDAFEKEQVSLVGLLLLLFLLCAILTRKRKIPL